jgi:diguanylate cyclase (GGDEF)-like protein
MARLRLLIAENDKQELSRLVMALDTGEYELCQALSGAEALKAAESHSFQIFLLDIALPDIDGSAMCRNLRRAYFTEPLQIVLLSDLVEEPLLSRTLELGGDDFIRKPVSDLELQVRIRAASIRYRSQLNLVKEREFYRQAVKQEEDLSSKILDQNLVLKKAYENMEIMNRELERLNKDLSRLARFDVLSGLMNRMSLFNMIEVEMERAVRSGISLCGLMLDIDHFKRINDSFGHPCGDEVIRAIGRELKQGLRKYDNAGRYGGEEFFIILPNSNLEQARQIADRFRLSLAGSLVMCGEEKIRITASLGVAQFHPGESKESWIGRADRAMYIAKQAGRNSVAVDTQPACGASAG